MPEIQLLDGKKISFVKSISGFELTKNILLLSSIPLIFIFVAMIYLSIKNV